MRRSRILVWGIGGLAEEIFLNNLNGEIIGFIQTNRSQEQFFGIKVFQIDEIPDSYDYVVIANIYTEDIYQICLERKIDINKVIFLEPMKKRVGCTDAKIIRNILGEKNYTYYCNRCGIYEESFFYEDMEKYKQRNTRDTFRILEEYKRPIINDKYANAGAMNNYFWQDLWAASLIRKSGVKRHVDIGSRIDGFIAHLLVMDIEVNLIDIREFPGEVKNLHTIVDDATMLTQVKDNSIDSLSALCSLEHFGLGRYGDPIDPEACFKCFQEIQKKLTKKGNLYIAVPIGHERLEFNAHRVFFANTIVECFSELTLMEFSCAVDGKITYNVDLHQFDDDTHYGGYCFGLFWFTK